MTIDPSAARNSGGTRSALIDAAGRSLAERGYVGTTTAVICSRAGVTSGALFGHFPTKVELLAHTARALSDHGRRFVEEAVSGLDLPRNRFGPANLERRCEFVVDTLNEVYREPEMQAALELTVVARTSPALAAALAGQCPSEQDLFYPQLSGVLPELDADAVGRAALAVVIDAARVRTLRAASPAVVDVRDSAVAADLNREEAIAILRRLAAE